MPKVKPIGYSAFARKLVQAGYIAVRKSKHTIYFHPVKEITIPLPHQHRGDIPKGLLHKLIKEMAIAIEDFEKL